MATKKELITLVRLKTGLTNAKSKDVLDNVLEAIEESLYTGGDVRLIGFGSFKVVERASRKGRNPKTGEEIEIPASKVVKFIPSKRIKNKLNGKKGKS